MDGVVSRREALLWAAAAAAVTAYLLKLRSSASRPALPAAGAGASAADSAENPWIVSEGERNFKLGEVRELEYAVQKLLLLEVPTLRNVFPALDAKLANRRQRATVSAMACADASEPGTPCATPMGFINFTSDDSVIIGDVVRNPKQKPITRAYIRAGPRESLYFDPTSVRAAIVACGGLCPGMNNVVRELVNTLTHGYGVSTVYGLQGGFWGFWTPSIVQTDRPPQAPKAEPKLLTPEAVADIQHYGGVMLGSDRGGNDLDVAVRFLTKYNINQLYVIGGDGTHRGANAIYEKCASLGMPVVVCGLPKTIDNDVDIIDRSFGFDTAVSEAVKAIKTAKIEAQGAPNGIGLVKLMGRFAGFISAQAVIASGEADLCLIPEIPIVTEGPTSIFAHLKRVLQRKGHAVVVVAEGAGEELLTADKLKRGEPIEVDAGGNRKLPPIGTWLKKAISQYFESEGIKTAIKYLDPSYMIRSVPANPADSVYCTLLAQSAVHGAMAGYTGFSVGLTNNRLVYLPITAVTANSPRRMNPRGRTYERMISITGQPDPLSDPAVEVEWRKTSAGSGKG